MDWDINFRYKNYIWNQTLQEVSGYFGSANYLETLPSGKLNPEEWYPKAFESKGKEDGIRDNLTQHFVFSLSTKHFDRVSSSSVTFCKGFLLKEKHFANTFLT